MTRRSLTKQEVAAEPFCVWNAVVDLLAVEEYEALSPEQRPAHLVFWYESEVQSGGHLRIGRLNDVFGLGSESLLVARLV